MSYLSVMGNILETKMEDRNGVPVGIIKGYLATFDIDRGGDLFSKDAFTDSLSDFREKNRPIRLKDHHGRTIGGFPIENVTIDEKGLHVVGEVNLELQQGREAHSLAKQGVISELSIGFESMDDEHVNGIRVIKKANIWEGSLVDEPMNINAKIVEVKSNLPVANKNYKWHPGEAIERLKEHTHSLLLPNDEYKSAFVVISEGETKSFDSYSVPIVDIVDGVTKIIPAAVVEAANIVQGLSDDIIRKKSIQRLKPVFEKIEVDFPIAEKSVFDISEVKAMTVREMEKSLYATNLFSKKSSAYIASNANQEKRYTMEEAKLLIEIKEFTKDLKN